MKTEKNILIAFILNSCFGIFELIGGGLTNSYAIISDAIHDIIDALSIGISFVLEKVSKKKPNDKYTYGFIRYSVIGSLITTVALIASSIIIITHAYKRILDPVDIDYNGMILFAVIGVIVNLSASIITKGKDSLNERAVNLHMLEDVLGWIIVLIGAIIMKFTNISLIDPILSILVSTFIFINAIKNFKLILDLFLEKTPTNINISELKSHILKIKGVQNVHHIHVWSIDGFNNYATMHVVTNKQNIKEQVKKELKDLGISHSTIEIESPKENCKDDTCEVTNKHKSVHSHKH